VCQPSSGSSALPARGIEEVGHYIDANGNNLWGIDPHADPRNAQTIILASDRQRRLSRIETERPVE